MTESDFSLRLARLREQKGVSARDMSLSMGQNAGYINNIETGKSMPSLTGIFYICDYLKITPGELFDTNTKYPQKMDQLINNLKRLNEKQLDNVSAIVESLLQK